MRRAGQAIIDQLEDLTTLLTREQGKPRAESYSMELVPTIDTLRWLADAAPEILDDERVPMPVFLKQKRSRHSFEPLGVVGVIAPWNYPWSIPFGEVAFALMAGNGVVLKPASLTPLIGQRIQDTFERAGLPEGLVRTIHGGGAVGQALVESSAAKIFFTGSVEVGRRVGMACASRMKGSVLELGGKDAMIVCADANLPNAISGCLWGGFANAGQTCSGIERVYVEREVADRFIEGVVQGAKALRVGDPMEWTTEVGPMVSRDQLETVRALVDDAVAAGATLRCGGQRELPELPGADFYAPAVLTGVTHEMRIMREEIFGPVVPIVTVDSLDEAIAPGQRLRLRARRVGVDEEPAEERAHGAPARGRDGLGQRPHVLPRRRLLRLGRGEGLGARALALEVRPLRVREREARELGAVAHARLLVAPYDESLGRGLHASAQLLYGRDSDKPAALRRGLGPLLRLVRKSLRDAFRR